jgi:hypothetical protein
MSDMAWIESHTTLGRHRKLIEAARPLRLRPVYLMGHLHALWHATLEQAEDGDLSSWSDDMIAHAAEYPGEPSEFVRRLFAAKWLDGDLDAQPRKVLVHDWLDYAGLYLTRKYGTRGKEKLNAIWLKHGREYGAKQVLYNSRSARCTTPARTSDGLVLNSEGESTKAEDQRQDAQTPPKEEVLESHAPFPPALDVPVFHAAWGEWLAYRRSMGWKIPKSKTIALRFKEFETWGVEAAVESIHQSIRNAWQGLFKPKQSPPQVSPRAGNIFGSRRYVEPNAG